MDAERFGRALGFGVRATAKALLQAADAATAPNPRPPTPPGRQPTPQPTHQPAPQQPPQPTRRTTSQPSPTQPQIVAPTSRQASQPRKMPSAQALQQGSKRFGSAVFAPAARAGSVLWFELTGVFFGLFALAAAVEVWKRRLAFTTPGPAREKVFFALAMFAVFAWFTLSSFLKAHRRAHRP